jgi:radical SAM superfamily enzyme YgiQ (UPF0313 family)
VDLADDLELMELMLECNFDAVFLGIETPDEESLQLTKKFQNTRVSLTETVEKIIRAGLRPMAGFIIGFDGEKKEAASRIIRFVEEAAIPTAMFGMLQALPNTALWHRLEKEGRLRINEKQDINQSTLMNFLPTRPIEDIAKEYIEAFWTLYDPEIFLDRTYRCFLKLGKPKCQAPFKMPSWTDLRALGIIIWRQGFKRHTRWKFWHHLFSIIKHNPQVWEYYLTICAHSEHFLEYRQIVRDEIEEQLAEFQRQEVRLQAEVYRLPEKAIA